MTLLDDVDGLRAKVSCDVHARGDDGYQAAIDGFNILSPTAPDVVVRVESAVDVQEAVRFADAHDLPISIQSTGHGSYRTVDSGVLIRTDRLADVEVDAAAGTVTFGAGARWWDILPRVAEHGLSVITGSSPSVGAVGLTLGGGVGPLSRTLGWAADRAVSYRLVDGAGELVEASADENPDLFRALKGGKVGLGVVTSMTLAAVPLREVYGGGLFFAEENIEAVHRAWLEWAAALPEAANTSIAILRMPPVGVPEPLAGRTVAHVRFAYVDTDATGETLAAEGEALLAPMREVAPIHLDLIGTVAAADVGSIHAEPLGPLPIWEFGEFLDPVDQDYVSTLLRHGGGGVDAPFAVIETRLLGGAIAREPHLPNAIGGRGAAYALLVLAVVPSPEAGAAIAEAGAALFADLEPYQHAEVNYNWAGHPGERSVRLWPQATAEFLAGVRGVHDPRGRFAY